MKVFPEAGPPAKKTAFNIPGSFTPSLICSFFFGSSLNFKAGLPLISKSPFSFHSIFLITTFLFLNLPILTVSPISIGKSTPSNILSDFQNFDGSCVKSKTCILAFFTPCFDVKTFIIFLASP